MSAESAREGHIKNGLFTRAARGASERVLDFVDPDVVLEHVDVNALLDRVDVNALLDRVDVNALLDRVDVNALLDRVDVNALLERVDVDALMARADVDALMEGVNVKALVDRAGIPEIVAESTGHLGSSALDLFRRPIVGIDEIVFRGLNRLLGRDPNTFPRGPGDLLEWVDEHAEDDRTMETGRYAGPMTRLLAVMLDALVVTTGFTLILAGVTFVLELLGVGLVSVDRRGVWFLTSFVIWVFLYSVIGLAIFGKTLGKAVMGMRVVGADGSVALKGRQALVRVLAWPISLALFGLGLVGIVFGRERRAWHDHLAGSAVVYDWGSRTARMPTPLADWLDKRRAES